MERKIRIKYGQKQSDRNKAENDFVKLDQKRNHQVHQGPESVESKKKRDDVFEKGDKVTYFDRYTKELVKATICKSVPGQKYQIGTERGQVFNIKRELLSKNEDVQQKI